MKYSLNLSLTLMMLAGLISLPLHARSFRVAQLPNGNSLGCGSCHVNPGGGGARTEFGLLVQNSFLDGSGNVLWGPDLALADSDGDGFSNGHELEDPFGVWTTADPAPGETSLVSNPGDNSSRPSGDGAKFTLHVGLAEMSAHMDQFFQIRVELASSGEEVAFAELDSIRSAEFEFSFMHILESGESYDIEFWADHNGNGFYDAPPLDHAWRISLSDIADNQDTLFIHNTEFVDIGNPVSIDDELISPTQIALHSNFPNPFNPVTTIGFDLAHDQELELSVYNLRGERVRTLHSGFIQAGAHEIIFDARGTTGENLSAGVYFYTLRTATGLLTHKMTLLK